MNKDLPLANKEIIIDSCIFMEGIFDRNRYSFSSVREAFLDSVVNYFDQIYIHEVVYKNELDVITKNWIDEKKTSGKIKIVKDPKRNIEYSRLLLILENDELLKSASRRKNQGEIHSIAYAKFYNLTYFSTNDRDAKCACENIPEFKDITIVGLEVLLVIADIEMETEMAKETRKIRKSIYKAHCKRNGLPATFSEFCQTFI